MFTVKNKTLKTTEVYKIKIKSFHPHPPRLSLPVGSYNKRFNVSFPRSFSKHTTIFYTL